MGLKLFNVQEASLEQDNIAQFLQAEVSGHEREEPTRIQLLIPSPATADTSALQCVPSKTP